MYRIWLRVGRFGKAGALAGIDITVGFTRVIYGDQGDGFVGDRYSDTKQPSGPGRGESGDVKEGQELNVATSISRTILYQVLLES